jgi:hypothetical protein
MGLDTPIFPAAAWDGVENTNRDDIQNDRIPDTRDYDTVAAEIVAVETFIKNNNLVYDPRIHTTEAGENINAGAPLYIDPTLLTVFQAQAINNKYELAGLSLDYFSTGDLCNYISEGIIELTDWTDATGTIALVPSMDYFLDSTIPGQLTNIVPTIGYVVRIGRALTPTQLDINIFPSVKL